MNKDKIIEKLKDLIVYLNAVIISGHREPEIENKLLDEIAVLESEQTEEGDSLQSSEPEKHKTATQTLYEKIKGDYSIRVPERILTAQESDILAAMEEYASQSRPEKVSDSDIADVVNKKYISIKPHNYRILWRDGFFEGAKAMRDNKMK